MRFPWQRRADEERGHRVLAEKRRDDAWADWAEVQHAHRLMRHQRELNGWTQIAVTVFAGAHEKKRQ